MITTQKYQFCTFRIHSRLYGFDIQDVKEVNPQVDFTPVFHAPKEVKGYVNIRGQIYLLLNLRRILGFEDKEIDGASRVVLFKPEVGEFFGVLVDNIADIVVVGEDQIENRRKKKRALHQGNERRGVDIAGGVCMLEDELLVIINSRYLLNVLGNLKTRSER